ncbi:hypothetical protein AB4305_11945, partial [Nocardia sp. 2YAB30]|uniref:hypothetical protein n=1 Tax=unclassified Nocardia TaxID=2637762 RepID=UPI003F9B9E53
MVDVWQRLARQVVGGGGGKKFSIEGSTATDAARALAEFEGVLSDITSSVGESGSGFLSFDVNGFG